MTFMRVRKIKKIGYHRRHVCLFLRRSAWNNSAPTGRIFMGFDIWGFSENLSRKIQVSLKSDKNKRCFTWKHIYIHIYIFVPPWILLRVRNISEQCCRENQNTHFVFSNFFFENSAFYDIMWKNIVEPDRSHDHTAHTLCVLDVYKYTLTVCNICNFSTVTMATVEK